MFKIYATLLLCLAAHCLSAQYGTLDPTFGEGGLVRTWDKSRYAQGHDMLLLPDGKILVTGVLTDSVGRLAVWRYLSNGDPDVTFGKQGLAVLPNSSNSSAGFTIAVHTDGKIVVAGFVNNITHRDLLIARFLANGKIDASFGGNGFASLDVWGELDFATNVAIQPDGSIVAVGVATPHDKAHHLLVARFRPDGILDASFGDKGIILPDYGIDAVWGDGVAVLKDGKILIGATYFDFHSFGVQPEYIMLLRYLPDGSPDLSFGENGRALSNFEDDVRLAALLVQPDDKIVVAGQNALSSLDFSVSRFHPNGSVDTDFGEGGQTVVDFDNHPSWPLAVAMQADGKILAFGVVYSGLVDTTIGHDFALLRLSKDGRLDATFGTEGKVLTNFGHRSFDFGHAVAVQPDHKIVVAGYSQIGADWSISLARYGSNYDPLPADTGTLEAFTRLYPNPTGGDATLEFWLGREATVSLDLYDVQGRLLQNLWYPERRAAGAQSEVLTLSDLVAASAYFLVLTRDGERNYLPVVKQ